MMLDLPHKTCFDDQDVPSVVKSKEWKLAVVRVVHGSRSVDVQTTQILSTRGVKVPKLVQLLRMVRTV